MTTDQAVAYFGGIKKLSEALDIWPHNIARWGDYPPLPRQYEIEVKTGGELKAESEDYGL